MNVSMCCLCMDCAVVSIGGGGGRSRSKKTFGLYCQEISKQKFLIVYFQSISYKVLSVACRYLKNQFFFPKFVIELHKKLFKDQNDSSLLLLLFYFCQLTFDFVYLFLSLVLLFNSNFRICCCCRRRRSSSFALYVFWFFFYLQLWKTKEIVNYHFWFVVGGCFCCLWKFRRLSFVVMWKINWIKSRCCRCCCCRLFVFCCVVGKSHTATFSLSFKPTWTICTLVLFFFVSNFLSTTLLVLRQYLLFFVVVVDVADVAAAAVVVV